MIDWFPIRLSFAVASAATLIAPDRRFWHRVGVSRANASLDAICWMPLITLPLVLPPTVLGYYLLVLLGTRSPLGGFLYNRTLEFSLTFTVTAAIIAATIHALPLVTKLFAQLLRE